MPELFPQPKRDPRRDAAAVIWRKVLTDAVFALPPAECEKHLRPVVPVSYDGRELVLAVPGPEEVDLFKATYRTLVEGHLPPGVSVRVVVAGVTGADRG